MVTTWGQTESDMLDSRYIPNNQDGCPWNQGRIAVFCHEEKEYFYSDFGKFVKKYGTNRDYILLDNSYTQSAKGKEFISNLRNYFRANQTSVYIKEIDITKMHSTVEKILSDKLTNTSMIYIPVVNSLNNSYDLGGLLTSDLWISEFKHMNLPVSKLKKMFSFSKK